MEHYNKELTFLNTDLIYIPDTLSKKRKIIKILDELSVSYTHDIMKECTHYICTKSGKNKLLKQLRSNYGRKLGRDYSTMYDIALIYKYNNKDRIKFEEDSNKILDLFSSGNKSSIRLACTLVDKYLIDPQWIPWLRMNTEINDCTLLLRKLGIDYRTDNKLDYYTRVMREMCDTLHVDKSFIGDFTDRLLNN